MRLRLSVFISTLTLLTACGGSHSPKQAAAAGQAAPIPVTTITLGPVELPSVYEAVGTVRARSSAVISSKVMAYVREVKVQPGDSVREGQLLILLDARDLDASHSQAEAALNEAKSALPEAENGVAAAKANLDLAEVTFGRMKDLFDKRSISNQEFDEASAKVKLAQASYQMAVAKKNQLGSKIAQAEAGYRSATILQGYSHITAPFAGIVTEKSAEIGNLAAPGAPLLTIEREGAFRLEAAVEESRLGSVKPGQSVIVELDAVGRTLQGRVSEIVPAVDSAARAFTVKIDLPVTPQLRSGLFGRARFASGARQGLTVPAAAVRQDGQLFSVLVADQGQAKSRLITVGERTGDSVEVLSGLTAGDRLIHPVQAGLSDGARVEVRQ